MCFSSKFICTKMCFSSRFLLGFNFVMVSVVFAVADLMAAAAKTAPKGCGRDTIVTAIVSGEDKDKLRDKLLALSKEYDEEFMIRDAGNIDNATCVVLIGCDESSLGMNNCSMCGFANCGENVKICYAIPLSVTNKNVFFDRAQDVHHRGFGA